LSRQAPGALGKEFRDSYTARPSQPRCKPESRKTYSRTLLSLSFSRRRGSCSPLIKESQRGVFSQLPRRFCRRFSCPNVEYDSLQISSSGSVPFAPGAIRLLLLGRGIYPPEDDQRQWQRLPFRHRAQRTVGCRRAAATGRRGDRAADLPQAGKNRGLFRRLLRQGLRLIRPLPPPACPRRRHSGSRDGLGEWRDRPLLRSRIRPRSGRLTPLSRPERPGVRNAYYCHTEDQQLERDTDCEEVGKSVSPSP